MRPKSSASGKTSACIGRNGGRRCPPDKCRADCCRVQFAGVRRCFLTVIDSTCRPFDCCIVGDDHAPDAVPPHTPNPGDHPSGGCVTSSSSLCTPGARSPETAIRDDQAVDPVTHANSFVLDPWRRRYCSPPPCRIAWSETLAQFRRPACDDTRRWARKRPSAELICVSRISIVASRLACHCNLARA